MNYNVIQTNLTPKAKASADAQLSMRLPTQTLHALKVASAADGRSVSAYAVRVIQHHLSTLVTDGRIAL